MNINHYWSVLCKTASVDRLTNNVTLGEVVEEIVYQVPLSEKEHFESDMKKDNVVSFPFEGILVSYLETDQPNITRTIILDCILPDEQVIKMGEVALAFGSNKRGRSLASIHGLRINGSGCYKFRITANEGNSTNVLGEIPLYITINFV